MPVNKFIRSSIAMSLFLVSAFFLYDVHTEKAYASNDPAAIYVYGQGGNFTSNSYSMPPDATSLNAPIGSAVDSTGGLYIADSGNNRVLYYPAGSTTATRVYGQGGSFISDTANNGGVNAQSLFQPQSVALDSRGNLYIADTYNSRVLYYPAGSTTSTRVYGQGGSFTSNIGNNGGVSADSLNYPYGIALDSHDNLYVADTFNARILFYPAGSTTATQVYGQGGSFTTNVPDNGGINATTMGSPQMVTLDANNDLYISDFDNNRVLYFPTGQTTAARVYGQNGSFTSGTPNTGGVNANSLNAPYGVALDNSGDLYIADTNNQRVLFYPAGQTTATQVYGQSRSFTTNTMNQPGMGPSALNYPQQISFRNGLLYIPDTYNNRVLGFQVESLVTTTQPPPSISVSSPFSTAFTMQDLDSGAVDSSFTGSVHLAIQAGSGASGATLSGTTTITAVNGAVAFSSLSIGTVGSGYILDAYTANYGYGTAATNTFSITGILSESITTSPSIAITLQPVDQVKTTTLGVLVTDTTQSNNGWHLDMTSTQFQDGQGHTLPQNTTRISSIASICQPSCTLPQNTIVYPVSVPAQPIAPAAVKAANAAPNTGESSTLVTFTLSLTIPSDTLVGSYSSLFTLSIISGP